MEATIENEETGVDGNDDFYSPSSMSSSPPKDFDINFESQYMPIFDEDDSQERPTSLASSLSIESNHDYTTLPVILTSNCRVIRCPVCEKPMRTFYCAKCIQKGQFVTIAEPKTEEFTSTAKSKLLHLYEIPADCEKNDCKIDEQKVLEEALRTKLSILGRKTETLRNLLIDQKMKLERTQGVVRDVKAELEIERKSTKSKEAKIELIKRYIASRKASVDKRRNCETHLVDELKQHASRRVFQLTNDVFPIEEINLLDQNTSFVNMETSPLLTFSDGSHHQIEHQTAFSIVEPWLPSNGDYSVDSFWLNDNEDHIAASMSDLSERNPAFRIGAGLAYTAQLVINLASYLNVILPAIIDLNTFNRQPLNDNQFSYNVAKLNANVIHLCISQGVDVSLLHPHRTLKNLMFLFNPNVCDLGRKPIFDMDNEEAAKKIEDQFGSDLSLIQDEFYDFGRFEDTDDISDSEWEISDTLAARMEVLPSSIEQSMQQNSYISRLPLRLLASFWTTGS